MFPRHRLLIAAALLAALFFLPGVSHGQVSVGTDSTGMPSGLSFDIVPVSPCSGDSVFMRVSWCPACVIVTSAGYTSGGALVVEAEADSGAMCDRCAVESTLVPIGRLAAGLHEIRFDVIVHWSAPGGSTYTTHQTHALRFSVADCNTGQIVPFLDRVILRGANGPLICAGDSIRVTLLGHFDDDCHTFRRAELYWPPYMDANDIRIRPPVVRILIDDNGCLGRPCGPDTVMWSATLTMPPLPTGPYALDVWESTVTCADTFPDSVSARGAFPFAVQSPEDCVQSTRCFIARFEHDNDKCDTFVSPGGSTSVTLSISSSVALAGLQGGLGVEPKGLRITALEAVGPAAGMILNWSATDGGARFVMFAKNGAPIPAGDPRWENFLGDSILKVTVEAPNGLVLAPVTRVMPQELLASDSLGLGVKGCPMIMTLVYDPRLDPSAHICADRPCDANGDGRSDVRDLVLMVRCLHQACPDSARFDCDHDGTFDLQDAYCCALRILRLHEPPDTTAVRPPREVNATLGMPRLEGSTLHVPLHVRGADLLAGAMFQLRFPSDRFAAVNVTAPGVWPLHSEEGGDLAVGFLNFAVLGEPIAVVDAAAPAAASDLDLEIVLTLKPGAKPGGEIELVDGQFAATSGERYDVRVAPSSAPVVPPDRASLTRALPNPFSSETRFSVDLPRAGGVELSVHDLSGRRVASLFRGTLPAGRRDFVWSGVDDRGGRTPQGVYFVRLVAAGETASQKIVLLREP
jgi:hypothetical protein